MVVDEDGRLVREVAVSEMVWPWSLFFAVLSLEDTMESWRELRPETLNSRLPAGTGNEGGCEVVVLQREPRNSSEPQRVSRAAHFCLL